MSNDINQVTISGRLVRPIDLRKCPNGKPVADLVIASNRKRLPKDDPERSKFATFVKVTLWNKDAEYWGGEQDNEPLDTGDEILVTGQLFGDDFTSKDGVQTNGRLRIDNASIKLIKRRFNDV